MLNWKPKITFDQLVVEMIEKDIIKQGKVINKKIKMLKSEKLRILITGGTGMVGKNFIENNQSKNYKIYAPTRDELNLFDFEKINKYLSEKT